MGNHQTTLNLSRYWKEEITETCLKHRINFIQSNPKTGDEYRFYIEYGYQKGNRTGILKDMGMWIAEGHVEDALLVWEPKDHALDFEVVDDEKYARGQIIGMVIDEDVGAMFKLAWNPKPKKTDWHLIAYPYQFDVWKRGKGIHMEVLEESLGLGNVCLLIQNGKYVELDDKAARSDESCVFTTFVDPTLDDFKGKMAANRRSCDSSSSSDSVDEDKQSEKSADEAGEASVQQPPLAPSRKRKPSEVDSSWQSQQQSAIDKAISRIKKQK